MKSDKILLVGGSGYIGQALQKQLHDQYEVYYTSRNANDPAESHCYLDYSKLSSIQSALSTRQFHLIIILASEVSGLDSNKANLKDLVFQSNVFGLSNLLQVVTTMQSQARLIYVSSMTVYDQNSSSPVKESSQLHPFHDYGLSKVLAEQLFSFHALTTDSKSVIIRLPGIFGGNKKSGFLYQAIRKLSKNETLAINTKNLKYWEPLFIDDVATMFRKFLQNYTFENQIEMFNFSYGTEVDIIKTAQLIKKILNSKSVIEVSERDYRSFYLDNKRLGKIISLDSYTFESSLKKYMEETL